MEFEDLKVEVPLEDEENDPSSLLDVPVKKYQNNDGKFVTGFDVTSKEAQEKRLKRAERFGISTESLENQQEKELIPSYLDILPKTNQAEEIRPDAILLFGVNEMSTKDVFDYFKDYMPGSIEWIDDVSCVIVWEDENSTRRALVNMGRKHIPPDSSETTGEEMKNIWRIGNKHPKSKQLLMRYATKLDKKTKGAGTRSLYYLVHGKPNQPKQRAKKRGLVSSSRKKKILADQQRINEELSPSPEVEILDVDMDDTPENIGDMDIDEPPVKVVISEDETGARIPRGNLYADQEKNSGRKGQSRLRKPDDDDDDVFSLNGKDVLLGRFRSAKMDEVDGRNLDNNEPVSTKNTKFQDLREKLKHRKQGFNPRTRPNLSIELTED